MARSAHAYVRGNTAKFYEWLADAPAARRLPEGPAIWICGDCHLGNLGPIANGNGKVEIQIRDLDQAVIGNPLHDLIRLGLSLATAARGSDLPGVTTARMIEQMVVGYEAAMADPTSGDTGPEPDAVRTVKRRALGRRWRHLAKERLEDVDPSIPLGKRFWRLEADEYEAIEAIFDDAAVSHMILSLRHREDEQRVRMVDAAYWMKGCSSLGLTRVAAIAEMRDESGDREYALVDIKQAVAPIAPPARGATMPQDQAERVVAAARALSPYLGERIAASRVLDASVFVRELMPQDLKLEVDQFSTEQAIKAAHYLAFVVGKAHARQMGADDRRTWRVELNRSRKDEIDAPSWLWESVVALAGQHEAAYLEHCRRYALAAAE
ncbi:DUF2252 family protein [Sphingomonas nostoxanthinifaciens]|uniref:DUF2252 family protein n=1 Tax=Sphingomonas nostoxanthinifaciens TaxID=2872652 RepID=UPI001CC2003B|nr:DUF2252 family protein [Sphingomonas nostoxanthinifaciens]UAK26473.1 DUF2252 domain-containing protein [Sphingomonas nostoxanthinifaciens]